MTRFCPNCGEEQIDSAKFCKNCGTNLDDGTKSQFTQNQNFEVPTVEKSYTVALVLGYIFSIFIPIIGIIIGIYLHTRKDSSKANRHGKYIIIVGVIVWILSILSIFR